MRRFLQKTLGLALMGIMLATPLMVTAVSAQGQGRGQKRGGGRGGRGGGGGRRKAPTRKKAAEVRSARRQFPPQGRPEWWLALFLPHDRYPFKRLSRTRQPN